MVWKFWALCCEGLPFPNLRQNELKLAKGEKRNKRDFMSVPGEKEILERK